MENQVKDEKILALRKALVKRKYFSILLALFTLGVNIFAWFVFTTSARLQLDATVATWDVQFRDDSGEAMHNFVIDVTKMKPGMDPFLKTISVYNRSDVQADFLYEVTSFTLLGHTIQVNGRDAMLQYLRTNYPFVVDFNASKAILNASDEVDFDISLTWPYENENATYYQQDDAYEFDSTLSYYQYTNGDYVLYPVANAGVYNNMKSSLYLDKDDADSYFGMRCHVYEQTTGNACLTLNVKLLVQQRNA